MIGYINQIMEEVSLSKNLLQINMREQTTRTKIMTMLMFMMTMMMVMKKKKKKQEEKGRRKGRVRCGSGVHSNNMTRLLIMII